jgi:mannosyltransferase
LRPYWLFMPAILIVGIVLRFYDLGQKSLWLDEAMSLHISTNNFSQIWLELTKYTNSPPLYLWLLHIFLKPGVNEFFARLPSALFGVATLLLIVHMGRLTFGKSYALYALVLFSLSPFYIYYSQEARMYSLWTFLIVLSYYYLYKILQGDHRYRIWLMYFISLLLNIYTHYFTVFHLITQIIIVTIFYLFEKDRRATKWWFFPIMLGLLALISIPVVQLSVYGAPHGNGIPLQNWTLSVFLDTLFQSLTVFLVLGGGGSYYLNYNIPLAVLLFILFYIGLYVSLKKNAKYSLLLLAWMLLPLFGGMLFIIGRTAYHERFFMPVTVPYLLFASAGLYKIGVWTSILIKKMTGQFSLGFNRSVKASVTRLAACFLPVFLIGILFINPIKDYYRIEKQDNRALARFISSQSLPGDSIILDGFGEPAMIYYLKGSVSSIKKPKSQDAMDALSQSCRRLWYVYGWESSKVWLTPSLFEWSQKNAREVKVFPGAFPVHVFFAGPDNANVSRILSVSRGRYEQNPEDTQNSLEYGNCLLMTGDWSQAKNVFEKTAALLQKDNHNQIQDQKVREQLARVLLGLGDAYGKLHLPENASLVYQEAVKLDNSLIISQGEIQDDFIQ